MKKPKRIGFVFAIGLAMAVQAASGNPPDALWTAHLDVARLAATGVGTQLRGRLSEPSLAAQLDAFQAVFRFDPRTDVHAITVFSVGPREEDAIAIVRGALDAEHISTVLRGQRGYIPLETTAGHTVHGWTERRGAALIGPRQFYGAFPAPDVFVFGQSQAAVVRALSAPNGHTPAPAVPGNAFLVAVLNTARTPVGDAAQAALLRHAKTVTVEVGAQGDALQTRLTLTAEDDLTANNLKNVLDGMISVLLLQAESNPDLAALAGSARVAREGNALSVDFALSLEIAERMIRNALPNVNP